MTEAEIQSIVLRSQVRTTSSPGGFGPGAVVDRTCPVGASEVRRLGERSLEVLAAAREAKAVLESGDAATALILLGRACR